MRKRYILLTKQTKSLVLYLGIASLTEPTITFEKLFSLLTSDSARGFNSNQLRIIIVPGVQYIFVGCKLHKGTYINDVRFLGVIFDPPKVRCLPSNYIQMTDILGSFQTKEFFRVMFAF